MTKQYNCCYLTFVFIQRYPHKHSSHIYGWFNFVEYPRLCLGERINFKCIILQERFIFKGLWGQHERAHFSNIEKQFRYTWLQLFSCL